LFDQYDFNVSHWPFWDRRCSGEVGICRPYTERNFSLTEVQISLVQVLSSWNQCTGKGREKNSQYISEVHFLSFSLAGPPDCFLPVQLFKKNGKQQQQKAAAQGFTLALFWVLSLLLPLQLSKPPYSSNYLRPGHALSIDHFPLNASWLLLKSPSITASFQKALKRAALLKTLEKQDSFQAFHILTVQAKSGEIGLWEYTM